MLAEMTSTLAATPILGSVINQPSLLVDVAGKVAPMASIALYLAPLPTIQKIVQDKEVGDLPLLPYSSMATSGFLWATYGILQKQTGVWMSNGAGALMALFYALQFARFAPKQASTLPGSLKQHRNIPVAVASMALVAALTGSTKLVGLMCVGICLALFGSPLASLKTVISSKSAASIPLPMSVATTVNCFLWTIFGIFEAQDWNVFVPNGIGFLLGAFQLSLKFIYGDGRVPALQPAVEGAVQFEKNPLLEQEYAFVGDYPVHSNGHYFVEQGQTQQKRNRGWGMARRRLARAIA